MTCDQVTVGVISRQAAIESDAHFDQRSAQFARYAIAVAAHLDVVIPRYDPPFVIGRIKAAG